MIVHVRGSIIALALICGLTIWGTTHLESIESDRGIDIPLEMLPHQLQDWSGKDTEGLDLKSRSILRLDRFLKREYVHAEHDSVQVYTGYWKKQTGDYQAAKHSPALCLPSNGWSIEYREPRSLHLLPSNPEHATKVRRIVGEIGGRYYLFYYWFFTGLEDYSEEWKALLNISMHKFLRGRSNGGIVEVSTPLSASGPTPESLETSSKRIESFLGEFYPELHKLLEHAR